MVVTSTTATPHGDTTCVLEERYECERCHRLVCHCNGNCCYAICDGCWSALDADGWTDADLVEAYGSDVPLPQHGQVRNWHHEAGGRVEQTLLDDAGDAIKLPYDIALVTACEQYCANCHTWVRCDSTPGPTSAAAFKTAHTSGDCTA